MELQFPKKTLQCLQRVIRQTQSQEQTQEVRLPEAMPDIGRVVSCWAQPVISGKEWHADRIGVSGGVMAWVMYVPEESDTPQSVAAWLPFQMKWEIPQTQHDGTILVQPFVRSADARSLSARKLMLRVNLGICAEAMAPGEAELYMPESLPEDIRVLKKTYPVTLPVEAGEKAFQIDETFPVSDGVSPEHLVRFELRPELADWKLMADKIVFRGIAKLHVLYRGTDGQIYSWDQQIPFSQYADLDKEYDDGCSLRMVCILTNLELDILPGDQLSLKAGIAGQYVICERPMVQITEDACSPLRRVNVRTEEGKLPAILDRQTQELRVEQTVETDAAGILDLAFYPDYPQQLYTADGIQIQMPGVFQLLYRDTDGSVQNTNAYWEETWDMNMAEDAVAAATLHIAGIPKASMSSNGILMQADIRCDTEVMAQQGLPMVTGLELGELRQPDPNRPSLILRRAGEDSLWQIAKETGSTVESILSANGLTGEPSPEKMLLIPIP